MKKEYLNPLRWKRPVLVSVLLAFVAIWFLFIDTYSLLTRYQLESRKNELIERTAEYNIMAEELIPGEKAIWFLFIDTYSLLTRYQLESRKNELIERTAEYNIMAEELKVKINALENNPDLLEKIAREEYGMRKPGETVYRIEPAD